MNIPRREILRGLSLSAGAAVFSPLLARLEAYAAGDAKAQPKRFVFFVEGNGLPPSHVRPKETPDPKRGRETVLNVPLDNRAGLVRARLAGSGSTGLGMSCWQARDSEKGVAVLGIVAPMLFYNLVAALIFVWAGLRLGIQSPLMWPAMVAHIGLGSWCLFVLWLARRRAT